MVHRLCGLHRAKPSLLGVAALNRTLAVSVVGLHLSKRVQLKCLRSARISAAAKEASAEHARSDARALRSGADPGSWGFSPEWMGTQAGGWGHNAGEVVFSSQSSHGNGQVLVTRHFASKEDIESLHAPATDMPRGKMGRDAGALQEWRVLRFNEETRQSVARVDVSRDPQGHITVEQRPDCMAFLYMKTLGAAVASLVGLAPPGSALAAATGARRSAEDGPHRACRALCVGLGGGTLPLFLAHHFPGMELDVVEIDPVVIAAAEGPMGFPREQQRPRIRVHEGDAVGWLREQQAGGGPRFDLAFVDAFDGDNQIPTPLTDPGGPFLKVLAAALDPECGVALVNVHRGELPPLWKQVALKLSGKQWLDPFVTPIAQTYGRLCLGDSPGRCYMLGVGRQYNTVAVAARGQHLADLGARLPERLREAASAVGGAANFRFDAAERASLDFADGPA